MEDKLLQSFVEISQTSKGLYKWIIRSFFPENTPPKEVSASIKNIDSALKEDFPKNVSDLKSSISMKAFDSFD